MATARIHVDLPLVVGATLTLPEAASHHLLRVLRLERGAALTLFNGEGGEFAARLLGVNGRLAQVELVAQCATSTESPLFSHYGLAISKGERMEIALQKLTELGVSRITPLLTARCEVRLGAERWERKRQHWQQVVISACEQSGRTRIPAIDPPCALETFAAQAEGDLKLFMHWQGRALPSGQQPRRLVLVSGPEGGLTEAEADCLERAGFLRVTVGPRILRTETAPLTLLSLGQWLWGDLDGGAASPTE